MATNRNIKEAGWFYHAPARRQNEEPVLYPPMSQIPMLSEDDGQADEPIRPLFRDTDTKYIRLAKQGGRPNLLQMKENSTDNKEPVHYPRNDWFYLEDNAIEDACLKPKNDLEYAFMRPEYMVHEPYKTEMTETFYDRPARGPLGYDRLTAFERDGSRVTDKTVRLPELRKTGYGVRSGRPLKIPRNLQPEKKPPSAQTDPGKGPRPQRYLAMPGSEDTVEKAKMGKILSYAYDKEWHDQLLNWQSKQDIGRDKHKTMTNIPPYPEDKVQSEYNMTYNKRSAAVHSAPREDDRLIASRHSEGKTSMKTVKQTETQRLREAKLKKSEQKDLFKMTRFKNVQARIETHRPPQSQRHVEPAAC